MSDDDEVAGDMDDPGDEKPRGANPGTDEPRGHEPGTHEPRGDDEPGDDGPGGDERDHEPELRARTTSRRRAAAGAAVLVLAAAAAVAAWRSPPPPPEGSVVLYGDSLSLEAAAAFTAELDRTTRAEVVARPVPGEAPCDALDEMRADAARAPDVVVIQFVGNNATACMRGPDGEPLTGAALAARVEEDVRAATELFATRGTRVVLVGGPDAPGLPGNAAPGVAEAYDEIVNEWAGRDLGRVRYADAAATVTGDDHGYADRLPCRDDEGPAEGCEDGEVVVRNPDRIHFCPVDHDELVCTVPSPGARRFGEEMARVTAMALDPGW